MDPNASGQVPDFPQPGKTQTRQEKAPPAVCSDGKDVAFAALFAVLGVLTADAVLYKGMNLGFSAAVLALLAAIAVYSWKKGMRPTAFSVFCVLAVAAGAVCFTFSADGLIRFCLTVMMAVLFAAAFAQTAGIGRFDCGTYQIFAETVRLALVIPASGMQQMLRALMYKKVGDAVCRRRSGGVLAGALCAVPVLLVLVPLLMRSDAAFEGVMKNTLFADAGEIFAVLLCGAVLFLFLFSLLFSARRGLAGAGSAPTGQRVQKLDCIAAAVFLGVISFFYVLYLLSQSAYFFSAFAGILPENFSVAAYARRGFFEMTAICAINLILAAFAMIFTRRKAEKPHPAVRALCVFICAFSLILIAAALSKMVLYVRSFGMTRLRVLTSLFMLLLAVTFICVAVRFFARRFAYMKVIAASAAVILLAAGYVNVDAVIARYNVQAYRSGALETVDVAALGELGDAAVPCIAQLLQDDDADVAAAAGSELAGRMYRYYVPDTDGDGTVRWRPREDRSLWRRNVVTDSAEKQLYALREELSPYLAAFAGEYEDEQ